MKDKGDDCAICGNEFNILDGDYSDSGTFVCSLCQDEYLYLYEGSLDQKIEVFTDDNQGISLEKNK